MCFPVQLDWVRSQHRLFSSLSEEQASSLPVWNGASRACHAIERRFLLWLLVSLPEGVPPLAAQVLM